MSTTFKLAYTLQFPTTTLVNNVAEYKSSNEDSSIIIT
jgi:hypothetical protein